MNNNILKTLSTLKEKYKESGFFIVGVFGSYARGEETKNSDIDILYNLDKKFVTTYGGWGSISKLDSIKDEIKQLLNIANVDLASGDNNSKTFQNTIKEELVYV